MLGAFFTPAYRDWWFGYIRDPDQMETLNSHWLVRKSAADAFALGTVKLTRLQRSMIEVGHGIFGPLVLLGHAVFS